LPAPNPRQYRRRPPPAKNRGVLDAWADGWRRAPRSLGLLRAFLGVTFVYAGVQKLADRGFFQHGSPDFIGTQIRGFANQSPIGGLLHPLIPYAVAVGILIALAEIVVGVATLAAVAPVTSAAVGMLVSAVLWLAATWHVHPYFLGSDTIYAVAWGALALGLYEVRRARETGAPGRSAKTMQGADRREFIRGGAVALTALVLGGLAKAFGSLQDTAPVGAASLPRSDTSGTPTSATPASHPSGSSPASPSPNKPSISGRPIASLDSLQVGRPVGFTGPGRVPGVLLRTGPQDVVAYSRVCTHAGCTVGYDSSSKLLVCPCHGAEFDPSQGARVVAGPAPTPLAPIRVAVDPATGKVVLQA
jgi:thiosulfate dehydrogenase [quinone] large subunit